MLWLGGSYSVTSLHGTLEFGCITVSTRKKGAGGLETFPELGWLSILAELRARQEHMRGSSILSDRKVAPRAIAPPPPKPVAPVVAETVAVPIEKTE